MKGEEKMQQIRLFLALPIVRGIQHWAIANDVDDDDDERKIIIMKRRNIFSALLTPLWWIGVPIRRRKDAYWSTFFSSTVWGLKKGINERSSRVHKRMSAAFFHFFLYRTRIAITAQSVYDEILCWVMWSAVRKRLPKVDDKMEIFDKCFSDREWKV